MTKSEIWDKFFGKEVAKGEARALYKSEFWKSDEWQAVELAHLQFNQKKLIMPIILWGEMVSEITGFPVTSFFPASRDNRKAVKKAFNKLIL